MAELGARLRAYRLQQNVTVAHVARQSGLNKNTILNAEWGKNPRLRTIISLLRAYGRLEALDSFLPVPTISPLQLVRDQGRLRRRARARRRG
jgi:transcriptional regulator with XRE-family HTH domain